MLNSIISAAVAKLEAHGASHVYSAFDAVPVELKNGGIFTVIGVSSFESTSPIYSLSTIFLPFKAELEIKVTAPENYSAERIYQYFSEKIAPAAAEFSGLGSFLKRVFIKFDSNINRLVLTAIVSAVGTTKIERSVAAQ